MKNKNHIRLTGAEKGYQSFIYTFMVLLLATSLFPLIYVVCLSFTSQQEIYQRGAMMVVPHKPTIIAYKQILGNGTAYIRAFGVSLLRTAVGTASTTFFSMILGYGLSRRDIPGKRVMLFLVMVTVLYGGGLIPTFLVINGTGLLDSFWSMIIPSLVNSWNVLVFKQFFQNLPDEIEEAAHIDGCSETRMLFSIVLPMSLPVLAALALFAAVGHWNSWFDAMIYIQSNTQWYPLQLLLQNLFTNANLGFSMNGIEVFDIEATQSSGTSMRMALTVIGTLPILCVYPFLQKYFVKGVLIGSLKG